MIFLQHEWGPTEQTGRRKIFSLQSKAKVFWYELNNFAFSWGTKNLCCLLLKHLVVKALNPCSLIQTLWDTNTSDKNRKWLKRWEEENPSGLIHRYMDTIRRKKEARWLSALYLLWKEFHLWATTWIQMLHCALYSVSVFNQDFPNRPKHFAGH